MSENNEHSPDDNETETRTREDPPNDSSKSEAKLMMNQMDAALLEDEEMPTYISVSSTTRPDDSDVVKQSENQSQEEETRSPSQYASDDQAASSVYVLSSEEDETDQHPYNDEDDEDEYADSDDMENLELDNEFNSERPSNMKHLMDDEDDDDEDDEDEEDDDDSPRQMHNYDDGIDDNYETDCYDLDGRSDDFILNRRLKNRDKEKSLSLQDLNMYKNNMKAEFFKRRHSQGLRPNYPNIPEHAVMYSTSQRKQPMPGKYHYVQSKVKRYIKDIKDQNRRSMEKHIKQHQEDTIYDNSNTDDKNNDTEKTKPTVTNKTIKDYAKRTIKELEIAETCDSSMDKVPYNATTTPIILNGQDNKNCLESIQEESIQNEVEINVPFESTQNERDFLNTDNKMQKQNGTIEVKQIKLNYPDREIPQGFGGVAQPSLIQNGHQEVPTVLYNLRTLSYEEYMHGTSVSSQKPNLNRNAHVEQEHVQPEGYNNTDLMEISTDNDEDTCPLRIENIKSIETMADEAKNNEQITFSRTNEEVNKTTLDISEVTTLRKKLTQKTVEYNSLLDTYQKQLMENLKMKQDLDKLRKTLTKYEKENKPREQKIASVQTDVIDSVPDQQHQREPTTVKQSNNKISGSSVASTLSSIDQWSSSACNLSISMKPPEVAKTLHSDDSMVLTDGTPGKTTRSLSREFITSSRIIQTLSNLTQGKTKPESPLIQNSKKRSNENEEMDIQNDDNSYQCQPSSSKKRKIADFLRPSNFLQPFNTAESHPKLNKTPKTESQFKNLCDSIIKNVDLQTNSANTNVESPFKIVCDTIVKNVDLQASTSNANANQLGAATSTMESKMETTDDPEDNVKCFVYREDESSKERSFLILAEVPENNKTINDKGRLRECGPYLIGNVEVRMSEVNGTLHIWGKELTEESTIETENEAEASAKSHWQKTPHTRFNGSNIVCSTSKKSKGPPKFELSPAASNFSCLHSPSFNVARASCSTNNAHTDKYSPDVCASSVPCEDCDLSKHKEWLKYKRMHPQEKLHSCCIHSIDTSEQKCNCSLRKEKQKFEDNFNCSKEKLSTQEHRRSFSRNLEPNKHLHENIASEDSEHVCRNCTTCNHSLHNPDNFQENHKCCNMLRETYEPLTMNIDREHNQSHNHSSHHVHEEEPLITLKQCSETPETRRRRLTGKRVRGMLMDLIRGCGDCYNPNISSNNKSCMHKKEPYLRSCSPQIKVTQCESPEPSCSNSGQPGRCCHAYVQRIESQLEEFRMEMERMRSRSDAILDMLNMLHSVDTN